MKANGGFTLVELLIVLTIIGILVALSINGFWYVTELQNRDRARIEIKALKTALVDYRSK
jgi:prepilin-type N-terminal cleavage/methylation domain-containing protein